MFRGGKAPEPFTASKRQALLDPRRDPDAFGRIIDEIVRRRAMELVGGILSRIDDGAPHTIRISTDVVAFDDGTRYDITATAHVDDPADVRAVGDRRKCRMEPAGEYDGRRAWTCDQCGATVASPEGGPLNAVLYCEQCGARIAN